MVQFLKRRLHFQTITLFSWLLCLFFTPATALVSGSLSYSQIPATDAVRRIAWSPDGSKIAVGSGFQFCSSNPDHINTFPIDILDASTGGLLKSLVGNHCYTYSVDWSPDSTKVVGTTIEPVGMRIWDVATGSVIVEGQMPVQGFIMAKWNPTNANWIAINTIGMGVAILNATTGELFNPLNLSGSSIDWSPDGTKLVVGDEYKNKVDVYDVMNSIVQFTFQGGSGFVAWSPDASKIASGSTDGNIYVWNAISGTPLTTLSGHINIVNEVNWSPDSSKIASASDDGTVRIWDATTGQQLEVIQGGGRVYTVDWSLDGTKIAYGGISGTVTIVPVPTSTNISPTANAGADQTVTDADNNGSEMVTLDGSGSSDSDGSIVAYRWTENGTEIANIIQPTISLSVGVHTITLTVTDDDGATATDEVTIVVVSSSGTGLRGQYYDDHLLTASTLKFYRITPTIDFNWTTLSPDTAIASDTFSIRWVGKVEPLYSEEYTFYVSANDGMRLWVNGQQIISDAVGWVNRAAEAEVASTPITLAAGVKYDIKLEYYENTGAAAVHLLWSSSSQAKQVIPASQLYPPEGQLAFTGQSGTNDDIFVINPDGTGETLLTPDIAASDNSAAWSPDGTQVAFVSARNGNDDIYVVNADGTNLRRLTNSTANDQQITWSPDNKMVAYVSGTGIYYVTVPASGTTVPTRTTYYTSTAGVSNPAWSPNGKWMALTVGSELYVGPFPRGTSSLIRLTNRNGYDVTPYWSPDGSKIAFRGPGSSTTDQIWVVQITSPYTITQLTNLGTNFFQSWSPDGTQILFQTTRYGGAEAAVVTYTGLPNPTPTRVTTGGAIYSVWSADGRQIAFVRGGDIYLVNPDGTNVRNLTNTPNRTEREIVWWQSMQTR